MEHIFYGYGFFERALNDLLTIVTILLYSTITNYSFLFPILQRMIEMVMTMMMDILSHASNAPPLEFSSVSKHFITLAGILHHLWIKNKFQINKSQLMILVDKDMIQLSPSILQAIPNANEIIDKLAKDLTHIFTSDNFQERDLQTLSMQDALNFIIAYEHYKAENYHEKDYQSLFGVNIDSFIQVFRFRVRREIERNSRTPDFSVILSDILMLESYQSFLKQIYASDKNNSSFNDPQQRRNTFKKLLIACLNTLNPDILIKELKSIESLQSNPDQLPDVKFHRSIGHKIIRPKNLFEAVNYYENVNIPTQEKIEHLLNIIEEYYSAILDADQAVIRVFEPAVVNELKDKLMGRPLPSLTGNGNGSGDTSGNSHPLRMGLNSNMEVNQAKFEGEHSLRKLATYLMLIRERYTQEVLLRHGLTTTYLDYLIKKFSPATTATSSSSSSSFSSHRNHQHDHHGENITQRLKEWNEYFNPPAVKSGGGGVMYYPEKMKKLLLTCHHSSQENSRDNALRATLYNEKTIQPLCKVKTIGEK